MRVPKRNARQEYQQKLREQIDASPLLTKRFPRLRGLKMTLEFFDAEGRTKHGEMKCKLNLEHAKSALWFACQGVECLGGDFDLSQAVAQAVAGRRNVASGELRCQGTRKRGDREPMPCQAVLRYKLILNYDGNKAEKR